MSHWPDLERCKALREKGFPQGESHFVWALTEIRSEDPKHRHNEWIRITRSQAIVEEIEGYPYYRLIAAPIATELLEDIKGVLRGAGVWRERLHVVKMEDGNWYAEPHYKNVLVLADIPYADTLPNALADLWLWLREKEKGEKG